jgi:hypothetical protein
MNISRSLLALCLILGTVAYPRPGGTETALGCEKPRADSLYCKNGKRREVCSQAGTLVWADTRTPVLRAQFTFLTMDGPIVTPHCGCIDALRACEAAGRDCSDLTLECSQALNSGGRFCVGNQWGGQTCY